MPNRLPGSERADRLAAGIEHIGDDVNIRVAGRTEASVLLVRRRIELAKPAAEAYEVIIADLLVTKQQGRPPMPDCGNVGEVRIAQASQVDPQNFGANGGAQVFHRNGHVRLSR